jgi:outer membrane protein assembly complex protein YaeT
MRRFAGVFRVFVLLAAAVSAGAAERIFPAPDKTTIASVTVRVEGEAAGTNIEGLVPIAAGEPYSLKKIDDAVKQVYKTGLFSDVRVLKEGGAEVQLTFLLTRKLLVQGVKFSGGKGVRRGLLEDSLYALRPQSDYNAERLRRGAEEIREALRREGYLSAEVRPRAEKDSFRPAVNVTLEIIPGPRFTIREVGVRTGTAAAAEDLAGVMKTRPGGPYVPAEVDEDLARIKAFLNRQGYPRADVALQNRVFRQSDSTVSLVIRAVPNERIRISIRGANLDESIVRPIWEERVFERWGLNQAEAALLTELRRRGYIFATVKSSIEKSSEEIHIIHDVVPGRKYRISDVEFEGLSAFTAADLRRELDIPPRLPLVGGLSGERLFEMPGLIDSLYKSRGFVAARTTLNFRTEGSSIRAVFLIEEGAQEKISTLSLRGAAVISQENLQALISSREGGAYSPPQIRRDAERLETYYASQGFRVTRVTATAEAAEPNFYDVLFDIQEGRPTTIDKIVLAGNRVTRRSVIVHNLLVREGEAARADRILESKRRLEKLGVFSEVKIEEVPAGEGRVTLVVSLREGERYYIGLGAGLETKSKTVAFEVWNYSLRPRGTVELVRGNMFGRAALLSLVGQFSLVEKRAVVSWDEPTLLGLPYRASLNAWLEREERVSYGFDRRGVSLTALREIAADWTSLTTLRFARTTLYFLDIPESEVDRQHFPYSTTSISESLIWDRRDDAFNPERGFFLGADVELAYPLFNAESDYIKAYAKYQRYLPLWKGANLTFTGRAGLGMGRMPIHERFFGGGANSFRGQPYDRLGPKDPQSGNPVGGKAVVLVNLEFRSRLFPTLPDLAAAVFYDKGNVFAHRNDLSFGGLEDALGVGLRYRTPLGPLRFDLGWNLNPSHGKRQPLVFVTIGNVF